MKKLMRHVFHQVRNGALSSAEGLELLRECAASASGTAHLHPLLHINASDLQEIRFSSLLCPHHEVVHDHVVDERATLPAAAQLEMMCAAVGLAHDTRGSTAGQALQLRNVAWPQPLRVERNVRVHVGLQETSAGIDCEIYSEDDESNDAQGIVYSRAVAIMLAGEGEPARMDIEGLRDGLVTMDVGQCYAALAEARLSYGPRYRTLHVLGIGTRANNRYVLAELRAADPDSADDQAYMLHPALLDGALQAAGALFVGADSERAAWVPFALDRLDVHRRMSLHSFAHARVQSATAARRDLAKLDIDVCDADGRVTVQLHGLSLRRLRSEDRQPASAALFRRGWQAEPIDGTRSAAAVSKLPEQRLVLLAGEHRRWLREYRAERPLLLWEALIDVASDAAALVSGYSLQTVEHLRNLVARHSTGGMLVQVVLDSAQEHAFAASALSGLFRSLQLEDGRISGQIITLEPQSALAVLDKLDENAAVGPAEILYRGDSRHTLELSELPRLQSSGSAPWRDGGVYLIAGGTGGLGGQFAAEIVRHAPHATVILASRRAVREQPAERVIGGARIVRQQLDVTDQGAVADCIRRVLQEYGRLDGVIHAAGVVRDRLLREKTPEEFAAVLAPKVAGFCNLDRATADLDLDLFVALSSATAELGSVGQTDYGVANAFLGRYACLRDRRLRDSGRRGITLCIDWPFWAEGGMSLNPAARTAMRSRGLSELPTQVALDLFYRACAAGEPHVVALYGDLNKLRQQLSKAIAQRGGAQSQIPAQTSAPRATADALAEKVRGALLRSSSVILKVPQTEINVEDELSSFGFDSISLTELSNVLQRDYGLDLTPAVFFEFPTIRRLAEHFAREQRPVLEKKFQQSSPSATQRPPDEPAAVATASTRRRGARRRHTRATSSPVAAEPIAIVGVSACFPGAPDLDSFWELLRGGRHAIAEIPAERWDWRAVLADSPHEHDRTRVKWGAFIDGVADFDPQFFGISPHEAQLMDPQQRLAMMHLWKVIEDAGYAARDLSGTRTGIFIGTGNTGYGELIARSGRPIEGYTTTGTVPSVGPNRMSYLLNLRGPSEPVETACSSSLVAMHRAVRAIRHDECEMALVGGVNTIITPTAHISFDKAGMLSAEGLCKAFSAHADGYVRGEGVGMLFLKRWSAARRDGDHVYALIRGTSENHGGRANSLTSPNPRAQADLIKAAWHDAGIDPASVTYIEAHGTGTALGDPVEINGLKTAFRELTTAPVQPGSCALGSVKSNIGHLEYAAGVAGVIKVLLQMKHRVLVPSLHCAEINPYLEIEQSPFRVVRELQQWEPRAADGHAPAPRRAGVSSFGFGGVNAHVVLEEAPQLPAVGARGVAPALIVLSARKAESLAEAVEQLARAAQAQCRTQEDLERIAYTLQVGREPMEHRLAFTAATPEELCAKLLQIRDGRYDGLDCYRGDVRRTRDAMAVINADEELPGLIDAWIDQGKHAPLLELWCKGAAFDWRRLYGDHPPQRIALPTYPFARQRCWVDAPASTSPVQSNQLATDTPADRDMLQRSVRDIILAAVAAALQVKAGDIDPDEPFVDCGVDSLSSVRVAHEIGRALSLPLSGTTLFNYGTAEKLAAHIVDEFYEQLSVNQPAAAPHHRDQPRENLQTAATRADLAGPIAIIGVSGRFPGCSDVEQLWTSLAEGRDLTSGVQRWQPSGTQLPRQPRIGALDDIECFDPLFFNISRSEALWMDPQQRLFLQESWRALEDAGYAGDDMDGRRCGVYVGCAAGDYLAAAAEPAPPQAFWGNAASVIPARIAYHLNLKGPAVAIDTACSSSLVALHTACQALRAGEIDMAIAGGAFVQSGPGFYESSARAGMLSPSGRCRAFDDQADGFVPGECVAAVVLKRLPDAQAAGDHIHAVLRGSAVNQDGATNGITAPNAVSQQALERQVYAHCAVRAGDIQMVEAHGTGTKLGDPIEAQALTAAFRADTDQSGFCALGSIKTNIGHAATAAGIAGVVKVVLSLQHRQIPPSLNYARPNCHIDFEHSPFYVNTSLRPWYVAPGARRLAAVSSFGFSGTNAHAVIEEAPPAEHAPMPRPSYLLALSARTADQLREQVQRLLDHCRTRAEVDWGDVSHTLLVGRRHLDCRLACVVRRGTDPLPLLERWLVQGTCDGILTGQRADDHSDEIALRRYGNQCIERALAIADQEEYSQNLLSIAELHVRGYRLDFRPLFAAGGARRIPLPTYPFAKERYWLDQVAKPAAARAAEKAPQLAHPLLHEDVSTGGVRRFRVSFSGEEPFLRDHVVRGMRVLPGVAVLEMVCAASQRLEPAAGEQTLSVTEVVWLRPIVLDGSPLELRIELESEGGGATRFRVLGIDARAGLDTAPTLHAQGRVASNDSLREAERVDLTGLRQRCVEALQVDACYETFHSLGLEYGPAHRGLRSLDIGTQPDGSRFVLAELGLPPAVAPSHPAYRLHPTLLDGALQATFGMTAGVAQPLQQQTGTLYVPFALEELRLYGRAPHRVFAYVTGGSGSATTERTQTYSLRLCDEQGRIWLTLQGLRMRPLERSKTLLLVPRWEAQAVALAQPGAVATGKAVVVGGSARHIEQLRSCFGGLESLSVGPEESIEQIGASLRRHDGVTDVIWIAPAVEHSQAGAQPSIERQYAPLLSCFRTLKALLDLGFGSRELALTIVTLNAVAVVGGDVVDPGQVAVHGLIGSFAKEYERWRIKLVDLPDHDEWPLPAALHLPIDASGAWVWRAGEWYRQCLLPYELPAAPVAPYRRGGTYVVLGGAGGIGVVFSEYLIRHYQAHVIWIGRRPRDARIDSEARRLAALGPAPAYISADPDDPESLARACRTIKSGHAAIHGVIHSAIDLLDRAFVNMDEARLRAGLAAKIDLSMKLAAAFGAEPLDFVVFFSSIQSFTRAAGQSNYAAGCAFSDAYAQQLARAWMCPVKVINWGYWGSVGTVATAEYRERMRQVGLGSVEPAPAMGVLQAFLADRNDQLVCVEVLSDNAMPGVLAGERIRQLASAGERTATDLEYPAVEPLAPDPRDRQLEDLLAPLLSQQLRELDLWPETAIADRRGGIAARYERWLAESVRLLRERDLADSTPDLSAAWIESKARWSTDAAFAAKLALVDAMLQALPDLLAGRRLATDVMFPRGSLAQVAAIYANNPLADHCNEVLAKCLLAAIAAWLHREPQRRLRILEIGAGTGSTTACVLRALQPFASSIAEYCYTDLSNLFLSHGREHFAASTPFLTTRLLDVERPLAEQGMDVGNYDVVIAANVLHATRRVRVALRNVKAALKPGGVLLINEVTNRTLFAHLTFGLLDGWWLHEDSGLRLSGTPMLVADAWQRTLLAEGFCAVRRPDAASAEIGQEIIAAVSDGLIRERVAAAPAATAIQPAPRSVPAVSSGAPPVELGEQLLKEHARAVVRDCLVEELRIAPDEINEHRSFAELGVDSLIAVNLANRIGRRCDLILTTTALFDYNTVASLAQHLVDVYRPAVANQCPGQGTRPGEPRAAARTAELTQAPGGHATAAGDFAALIERPGSIEDVKIVPIVPAALREHEVRIAVHAFSLNFADLLCVRGLHPTMPPYPFTPGLEVSGAIIATGSAVKSLRCGEAVVALLGESMGGHATVVTCNQHQVFRKPATLSHEEACSLPVVAVTMLDAFSRAQVRSGDKVLIQTAAGGTGLIGVQLAKHLGAEIYATAGSQRKLDYLTRLGVDHVINYREQDFAAEVLRLTGGRGVDVVINTLAGDALQKGIACLAPGGRYVEIAMTALKSARSVDLSVLNDNQSFHSIDVRKLGCARPEVIAAHQHKLLELVERQVLRPTVTEVVPFARLGEAYRLLESRDTIGKVVVSVAGTERKGAQSGAPGRAASERERVAIIGMSGRFAGSKDVAQLWEHLAAGRDLIEEVQRWELVQESAAGAGSACRHGGFLPRIDEFDAPFFNISGLEARYMDPQQRLFLEEAWKALEDAGYAGERVEGSRCGVYVGCNRGEYVQLLGTQAPAQAFWGNAGSLIPARIAYYLNLKGPAIAVDTACSSSLVAIHLASQSLLAGESELALAGGVFVQCTASFYELANRAGMLSSSGRCHTFDEAADGFVPGEGIGVVILKRLSEALADGDRIYGVIRGSAVNQDGATNGITAPSALSQELLERQVYASHGIDARQIQMVEAHGTGTRLGDPIELQALTRAFRQDTAERQFCAIGSIKTNLGHTAFAAGVAGVIKVLLSLQHRQIPASLHYREGNAQIDFAGSPFYVNTALREWSVEQAVRRCAAVSSFGFSGTNAHMVIEEGPARERRGAGRAGYLIVLSGRTAQQLQQQASNLVEHLERTALECADVSYTLLMGRRHCSHRLACVARTTAELVSLLKKWLASGKAPQVYEGRLSEHEVREQAALKRYGNQCIAECAQLDEQAYLEQLATIAELYVQGYALQFKQLFAPGEAFIVTLPAYPFARQSHWIRNVPIPGVDLPGVAGALAPVPRASDVFLLAPRWQAVPVDDVPGGTSSSRERFVVLCEAGELTHIYEEWQACCAKELPDSTCMALRLPGQSAAGAQVDAILGVAQIVQDILRSSPRSTVLVQVLLDRRMQPSIAPALAALLRSARFENPRVLGQVIGVDLSVPAQELVAKLRHSGNVTGTCEIMYREHTRYAKEWTHSVVDTDSNQRTPWKEHGVYLLTGGAGGLGTIFAREIARQAPRATVILVGRSPLSAQRQLVLERALGNTRYEYHSLDVADEAAVAALLQHVESTYGRLDGILHAAGVNVGGFVLKQSRQQWQQVLAAKVAGTIHLDQASRRFELDFFVLFSSIAAVLGNAGQAAYASANAFLDSYAEYRNHIVASGRCTGRTLSIGWPQWREGGLQMDASVRTMVMDYSGMTELGTDAGLRAFYAALVRPESHLVVFSGDVGKVRGLLDAAGQPDPIATPAPAHNEAAPTCAPISEQVLQNLKDLLSGVTATAVADIDERAPFDTFGLDSLMITQLNQALATVLGDISKTLFFEYRNLAELADSLASEYPDACARWTRNGPRSSQPTTPTPPRPSSSPVSALPRADVGREPIAIIGMAGHYPQADTLQAFWENLRSGTHCVGEIPWERWRVRSDFYEPDRERALTNKRSYGKWGGFLERFAEFDPLFFNMSPREAMTTDPQERLFLQACWQAVEDAGYTRERLAQRHGNRVGVFAGVTKTGFELHAAELWRRGDLRSPFTCFGSVANRVSYALNLNGPSMPIDTMCSASLTAVHEACEHLLRGECEMALAGGVNLYLHPSSYVYLCEFGVLSPGGRCRSFGQGADGIVPGEGVGVLLLKPLSRAVADGDRIYALIRSSSINHGGRTNGYTVPSPVAQRDLIQAALERACIHPRTVSFIEAHGTGTHLGDPIEIAGLTQAFRQRTEDRQFCALGSVKSNIGHLEAAAGVASLTKVVLQMLHGQLVPSLHAREVNPLIDFAASPFFIQQELGEWRRPTLRLEGESREYPRIAGVSSFGAGGANAHVIVEEYVEPRHAQVACARVSPAGALIVLSARTAERLQAYAQSLLATLEYRSWTEAELVDIAYTLQTGREAMEARLALHARSLAELKHELQRYLAGDSEHAIALCAEGVRTTQMHSAVAEQLARASDAWLAKGEPSALLRLWIEGVPVDWDALYRTGKPRRVVLPTYPFAHDRYWPLDALDSPSARACVPASAAPVDDVRARIVLEPLTPAAAATAPVADQPVLPTLSPESLQQQVVESLAAALYMTPEQIDIDTRFVDLGMDSIVGVEWTRALNRQFSITLAVTKLYDYPTVRELTAHLRSKLNGRVSERSTTGERELTGAVDEILQRVQQGTLDPAHAVSLLQQTRH